MSVRIEFGPFPEGPKEGDKVLITDPKSLYYGQEGECVEPGEHGGWWIRHDDQQEVYHPWGYEKVATDTSPE